MKQEDFVVGKKYRTPHNGVCKYVGPTSGEMLVFEAKDGCIFVSISYENYEEVEEPQNIYAIRFSRRW